MTTRPQNADLVRQLRSLSIVQDGPPGPTAPTPPSTVPNAGKPRRWPVVLLLGTMAITGAGYWATRPDAPALLAGIGAQLGLVATAPTTSTAQPAATVAPAIPAPPIATIAPQGAIGTGYVVAERESVIGADIGGRLTSVAVGVGDRVVRGAVLAQLDDSAARLTLSIATLAVTGAEQSLSRLQVQRDQAAADADRLARLVARGAAPAADGDAAGFALRLADQDLLAAAGLVQTRVLERDRAQADLARHTLVAPFDGVVVEQLAVPGDLLASAMNGGDPGAGLLVLLDTSSLIVTADLAETNLSQVRAGQTANVVLDAWPDRRFAARVQGIVPRASIQKGTVTVRLTFDAPDPAILANMAAKVTFAADASQ